MFRTARGFLHSLGALMAEVSRCQTAAQRSGGGGASQTTVPICQSVNLLKIVLTLCPFKPKISLIRHITLPSRCPAASRSHWIHQ